MPLEKGQNEQMKHCCQGGRWASGAPGAAQEAVATALVWNKTNHEVSEVRPTSRLSSLAISCSCARSFPSIWDRSRRWQDRSRGPYREQGSATDQVTLSSCYKKCAPTCDEDLVIRSQARSGGSATNSSVNNSPALPITVPKAKVCLLVLLVRQ